MSVNRKYNRVFGIGMHKTGTSTLGLALHELGFKVLGARTDLAKYLLNGNTNYVLEVASGFDALQDVPWANLFKQLDIKFPNSKFILTERSEDKWLKSVLNHFGDRNTDMRNWIYGAASPIGNEEVYLNKFKSHNEEVKSYFRHRPDDLLIVSWERGDGWEKLCPFLDLPIPSKNFPHMNKGAHNYNFKEKISSIIRDTTPMFMRKSRIEMLKIIGMYGDKDIFNNKEFNRNYREEKYKTNDCNPKS